MIGEEVQHLVGMACGIILLLRTFNGTEFGVLDVVLFVIGVGLIFI